MVPKRIVMLAGGNLSTLAGNEFRAPCYELVADRLQLLLCAELTLTRGWQPCSPASLLQPFSPATLPYMPFPAGPCRLQRLRFFGSQPAGSAQRWMQYGTARHGTARHGVLRPPPADTLSCFGYRHHQKRKS